MRIADFIKQRLPLAPSRLMLPLLHINHFGGLSYGRSMLRFKKDIPLIRPEQKLVSMANYAIEHVPYYRKRYGGEVISSRADFERVFGFIDKDIVREHYDEFISDEAARLPHVDLRTSGTTGAPLAFKIPANRYVTEMAFVTKAWQNIGWDYDIRATIRKQHLPKGRKYLVNPVSREIIFDGCRFDDEYIRLIHRVMKRNGVHTLYGYPSAVVQTLKGFERLKLNTSIVKYALLTSEEVSPYTLHYLTSHEGLKVANFYGHTEKLIFIEQIDQAPTYAIEPGYGLAEVIGEDGKPALEGELVGSTYYNRVMPLLRYRTGDYACLSGTTRKIGGIDKQIVSRIHGRRNQNVDRIDGSQIGLPNMETHDEIDMHIHGLQMVQPQKGYLELHIIKGNGYTPEEETAILNHYAHKMLGAEYVKIVYTDHLESLPNGKVPLLIKRYQIAK